MEKMLVFLSARVLPRQSPPGMHPVRVLWHFFILIAGFSLFVKSDICWFAYASAELFDLKVVEGETIREWLFFDKPRRAFESGNRKQRSLPDYNGRGWHESRKQMMNEFGGLKRSYYMDPQPMKNLEWHLYEYEINKYDACALYRLELKLVDGKKIPKGKVTNVSVSDLQKQMGRLTAEFPLDNKRTVKGRSKAASLKNVGNIQAAPIPMVLTCEGFDYGTGESYDYLVDYLDGYFIT